MAGAGDHLIEQARQLIEQARQLTEASKAAVARAKVVLERSAGDKANVFVASSDGQYAPTKRTR